MHMPPSNEVFPGPVRSLTAAASLSAYQSDSSAHSDAAAPASHVTVT